MIPDPIFVLIVDDEAQVCSLMREELMAHNCVCSISGSAIDARARLVTGRFDVMVADIILPHESGLELLADVKRYVPECKVVLVTGKGSQETLAKAVFLGACDYIEKPFAKGALVAAVLRAAASEGVSELSSRSAAAIEMGVHLQHTSLESVMALARAVEAKDAYTRRHSEQVAHYATHIATSINAGQTLVRSIRIAGLLHDIGKIGVPDYILTKPGPLTEDEFGYVRQHPTLGADILSHISFLKAEATLVRHHHERWDGTGYPDGLFAESIPLGSRIIQMADSIDAMLMARTYKPAFPAAKMLDELVHQAGTQFDPELVPVAVAWCRHNPDRLIVPGHEVDTLISAEIMTCGTRS